MMLLHVRVGHERHAACPDGLPHVPERTQEMVWARQVILSPRVKTAVRRVRQFDPLPSSPALREAGSPQQRLAWPTSALATLR